MLVKVNRPLAGHIVDDQGKVHGLCVVCQSIENGIVHIDLLFCPVMPSWHFLINSGPVPSHCHIFNGTHLIPCMPCKSCHDPMISGLHPHPDALMPQLCSPFAIVISCVSCFSLTHNFHLKHVIILQLQPCPYILFSFSHHHPCISITTNLATPFLLILLWFVSSIQPHLHVCIWHILISTCVTIAHST